MSTDDTNAARRGSGSTDLLGLVVDAAVIDCWKTNYGLEKTPAEIAAVWGNWAPAGAILALRAAVAEIERLRAELARCGGDNCMGRRCDDVTNWVTEQAARAHVADERERLCAAIKAADDKASESDYMLDSDDCISVIRGTWNPGA